MQGRLYFYRGNSQNPRLVNRVDTNSCWIVCTALAVAIAFVYAQTVSFGFVSYDDPLTLTENPAVVHGLTLEGVVHAFTSADINLYHPATSISHMVSVSLFGLSPGPHHLVNVAWHALAAMLLFLALRSLTGRIWSSAIVAALFALHPGNVESVAWVSQRKDTMVACFVFATFLTYSRYVRAPTRGRYAMVVACALMALLSKPVAVIVPVLLLVLDYWPLGSWRWQWARMRVLVAGKLPLFMLSVAFGLAALYFQSQGENAVTGSMLNPLERVSMALHNYAVYLGKVIYPVNLAYFYPFPEHISTLKLGAAAAVVVVISGLACWAGWRGLAYVPAGWIWFLIALAPTVGFISAGESIHPDRYLYLSSVGIFIVLVWGGVDVLHRLQLSAAEYRWVTAAMVVAILGVLGFQSYNQCRVWRNTLSLAEHGVRVVPGNYAAYDMAGTALRRSGRMGQAVDYYKRAIAIRPDHQAAHANLGAAYQALGRYDEALASYVKQLEVAPDNLQALTGCGSVFLERKNYSAAERVYLQWAQVEPRSAQAWASVGATRFYRKHWQASAEAFAKAAELEPENAQHLRNRAAALERSSKVR